MGYIKNFEKLALNHQRRIVLELVESALGAIQPQKVIHANFILRNNFLSIKDAQVNIGEFDRIFLLGFGKGSAGISSIIEEILGDRLNAGWVIDVTNQVF